ncbi:hypothetical protein AVEN_235991-1 [Araneus ventricosus]|uniref:SWIM-type domain-containing protein n=1 Tax=Araneus ventricosus TaxID=182803 RepID=A0A4Y2WBV5_ARAVE|nr:hypothetical protein AVEN_235990-1 [Araneus ventricosus]GBO33721.1 hypothetical protein AVEN_235991-1 [Araneus ventricosus]
MTVSFICSAEIYFVDVSSACCSCSAGMLGKFCKHQFVVYYYYNVRSKNFPAFRAKKNMKQTCLALGQEAPSLEFYRPFRLDARDIFQQLMAVLTELPLQPLGHFMLLRSFPQNRIFRLRQIQIKNSEKTC